MSITGITQAGEAYLNVTCEDRQLRDGLREVSATIQDFAKKNSTVNLSFTSAAFIKSAFSAIQGAYDQAVISLRDYGAQINELAGQTESSAERVSIIGYAAQKSGVSLNEMGSAAKALISKLANADVGDTEIVNALNKLSLSLREIRDLSGGEQFETLVHALAKIDSATQQAATGTALFGDNWSRIAPMITKGSSGLIASAAEAKQFGLTLTDAQAQQSQEIKAASDRMSSAWQGLTLQVGQGYLPIAKRAMDVNSGFLTSITRIATECPNVNRGFALVSTGITGSITAINGIKYATTTLIPTVKAVGAALMWLYANPVIAGLGIIAGAIAAIGYYSLSVQGYVAKLSSEMSDLADSKASTYQQDLASMQRLEEIVEKQSKSNEELSEAAAIAAHLSDAYGVTVASVNTLTGRITLATDAQKDLNKAIADQRKIDLQKEVYEKERNKSELEKSMQKYMGSGARINPFVRHQSEIQMPFELGWEKNFVSVGKQKEFTELLKQWELARKDLKSTQKQLELSNNIGELAQDNTSVPPAANTAARDYLSQIEQDRTRGTFAGGLEKINNEADAAASQLSDAINNDPQTNEQDTADLSHMAREVETARTDQIVSLISLARPTQKETAIYTAQGKSDLESQVSVLGDWIKTAIDPYTKRIEEIKKNGIAGKSEIEAAEEITRLSEAIELIVRAGTQRQNAVIEGSREGGALAQYDRMSAGDNKIAIGVNLGQEKGQELTILERQIRAIEEKNKAAKESLQIVIDTKQAQYDRMSAGDNKIALGVNLGQLKEQLAGFDTATKIEIDDAKNRYEKNQDGAERKKLSPGEIKLAELEAEMGEAVIRLINRQLRGKDTGEDYQKVKQVQSKIEAQDITNAHTDFKTATIELAAASKALAAAKETGDQDKIDKALDKVAETQQVFESAALNLDQKIRQKNEYNLPGIIDQQIEKTANPVASGTFSLYAAQGNQYSEYEKSIADNTNKLLTSFDKFVRKYQGITYGS